VAAFRRLENLGDALAAADGMGALRASLAHLPSGATHGADPDDAEGALLPARRPYSPQRGGAGAQGRRPYRPILRFLTPPISCA